MIRRTRVLVALLRAINVGGTGTLAMRDLRDANINAVASVRG